MPHRHEFGMPDEGVADEGVALGPSPMRPVLRPAPPRVNASPDAMLPRFIFRAAPTRAASRPWPSALRVIRVSRKNPGAMAGVFFFQRGKNQRWLMLT